jgi:hypothetical protein
MAGIFVFYMSCSSGHSRLESADQSTKHVLDFARARAALLRSEEIEQLPPEMRQTHVLVPRYEPNPHTRRP